MAFFEFAIIILRKEGKEMNLIIGAVVIILIIAGAAFFMSSRSDSKNATQDKVQSEKLMEEKEAETFVRPRGTETVTEERKDIAEDKKSEDTLNKEVHRKEREVQSVAQIDLKEKNKQKEALYQYINRELQILFCAYNKEEWDKLCILGAISETLYKEKAGIIEGLPSFTGKMLQDYFSCIDFQANEEGKLIGYVKDKAKLKEVFLHFMMPFYPQYYRQLSEGGLRHTALLHPNTLRLFQQLTGKKFRPGYRNRYTTGVRAFEWDKDRYKVYQKDGKLLCDAIFGADGIVEGYGQKEHSDEKHPDWNIVEEGTWKDGVFQGGILRYEYKKSVNL